LKYSARPDSDFAAAPLNHRDARTKKLLLIWRMGVGGITPEAQSHKVFLLLFLQKKKLLEP
jgi:hypothetical protein